MTDIQDQVQNEVDTASEPTAEDRAREMGWRPKEEFKGDETRWVDAETFIKRGEEYAPFIKANNKKLEAENAKLKEDLTSLKRDVKQFRDYHTKTEQRAYERALRDLEERQAEAVQANDVKAVREITREIADLSKDVQTDADNNPYESPDHAKALNAWKGENAWFGSDRVMTAAANEIANELEQAGVKGKDQLDEVSKRIRAEFPHKFQNERRAAPSAVEGAAAPRKGNAKSWNDIPPEARQFADRMVKQGFMTREQYVKDYFA